MQKKVKSRSQVVTVLKSLSRNKMAILGLVILILLTLMAIFAPYIAPYDYAQQDLAHQFQAPSAEHWFGTDEFGRDVFSRIVYGTRVSLLVGFVSVGIALLVGGSLGAIAGFYGKRVDNVIMRVMDVLLAIPQTLLAIAVAAALGSGLFNLMIAVGISSVPTYARIVRASVMTIRGEEYIEAATASGTNNRKIILKHILPNCVAPVIVQSSAAVMAITILLCSTGVLPIYLGIALVMGENIGTTATANLAALGANAQARRAALAHLVFNVFGVIWVLCLFYPFVDFVCSIVGYDPDGGMSAAQKAKLLPIVLAMFHTCFNVCNTGVLIWFIPQLEKVVCQLIKPKADKEDEDFRLRFIQAGIMKTPELSVFEAQQEIGSFGERIHRMFSMVRELMDTQDAKTFDKLYERIEKYEGISDNMEIEIAKYLDQVSDAHLSDDTKAKIRSMLRAISEIESIGDSCYNLARTIKRKGENKEEFTAKQNENIHQMFKLVDESLTQMNFMFAHDRQSINMNHTYNIETEINNFRTQLRNQNLDDVDNHLYTYGVGTLYMDIIQECEKLGDYVVNVAEARMGTRASA